MLALEEIPLIVHTRINANGRVVIPAEMRQKMGLAAGDAIVLTLEGNALKVQSYREVIREIQEYYKNLGDPNALWSEELIAERREEGRREMAEIDAMTAPELSEIA